MKDTLDFYKNIINQMPVGLVIWRLADLDDTRSDSGTFELVEINALAKQILDLPIEAELGETLQTIGQDPFPAFLKLESPQIYADVIHTATPRDLGEVHYRGQDSLERIFSLKAFPLPQQRVGVLFEDVTSRKQIEEALVRSEQKLAFHVQQTSMAVIEWNLKFEVVEWNVAAEKIFGFSREDALGQQALDLIVPHELRDQVNQMWQRLLTQKIGISATNENVRRNGQRIICEWHSTPLIDIDGKTIGIASLAQDVTTRTRAEADLQLFATRLQLSNRELQDFASVASHDLQEPLRKIQAFGDRLRTKCKDTLSLEGQDYLDRMQSAAGRMQILINDLLAFSRVTTKAQPFVAINLSEVLQEVLSDLEVQLQRVGGQIEVTTLPTIEADPLQMRQLLQNLISNALKFHQPGVPPVVKIEGQRLQAPGTLGRDRRCQITVSDNGIGFDEKYLDRIFTVFQRLHGRSEYEGTGVGLAICRKITERHGGTITARSQPGQGTTFIVTLPIKQPSEGSTV